MITHVKFYGITLLTLEQTEQSEVTLVVFSGQYFMIISWLGFDIHTFKGRFSLSVATKEKSKRNNYIHLLGTTINKFRSFHMLDTELGL